MYITADNKAIERAYNCFLASMVTNLQNAGWGSQSSLATACGRAQPMINAITRRLRQASFETQVLIASACGSEYIDFLAHGRDLLSGGIADANVSGVGNKQETSIGAKLGRLNRRGWADLEVWLDGYLAGIARPKSPWLDAGPVEPGLPDEPGDEADYAEDAIAALGQG